MLGFDTGVVHLQHGFKAQQEDDLLGSAKSGTCKTKELQKRWATLQASLPPFPRIAASNKSIKGIQPLHRGSFGSLAAFSRSEGDTMKSHYSSLPGRTVRGD